MNLSAVERIILLEMLFAGEVFVILLRDGRIQLVTSEFCGPGVGSKPEDGEVNGIIYNANGRPTGYRFATTDRWGMINFGESEIVDARYVIHVFDRDRVAMGRGLPWLLPSVTTFRDLYEIVRAKTKQVKDASQVFATLERAGLDKLVGIAGPTVTDFGTTGAAETADSPADKTGAAAEKQRQIDLKNGTVVALDPGEKISLLQSKYEAQDFTQLIGFMLRAGAAPAGLPVELWFSGFGDANYSASKAINAIQWDGRRQAICQFMESQFLNRLHRWRIAKARKEGDLPPLPEKAAEQEDMISWGWGRTPLLDKVEEAKAIEARMKLGLTTVSEEVSREGKFFEEELERRAEDYAKAAEIAKAKGVPIEALLPEAMLPPKKAATPAPPAN